MSAQKLKSVSKFSEDAINIAIAGMPEAERVSFQCGLDTINKSLGNKEKKEIKVNVVTDETIFKNYILAQIHRRVAEIEAREMSATVRIDMRFNICVDFEKLTIAQMMKEHANVIKMEESLQSLMIIAQFSRGMLYLELSKRVAEKEAFRDFVERGDVLCVSYVTVMRYVTLASMISKYPRLILCELTFSQILKHKMRLLKFLGSEDGQELNAKLSLSVQLTAQGRAISIEHSPMEPLTGVKLPTDPDWAFRDQLRRGEGMPEEKINDWLATAAEIKKENEEVDLEEAMGLCGLGSRRQ